MNLTEANIRDFFYKAATAYGFIHAHKELSIGGLRLDIFAIDENHNPYIVEFKKQKNRHIVGQSAHYLAMLPSYRKEVSSKINFHKINWDNLSVVLVAPEYQQHDLDAVSNPILKDRIHLYTYIPRLTTRDNIFGLKIKYLGPNEIGPLKFDESNNASSDLVDLYEFFTQLDSRESKREHYTNNVLPILQDINTLVEPFFSQRGLYFHTSYFGNNPPYYMIRYGTDKKLSHKASIKLAFYPHGIQYGFDLTHSLQEAKTFAKLFSNKSQAASLARKIYSKLDYEIYMPNTGFRWGIPIESLTLDTLLLVLQRYKPKKHKDCYFHLTKG